MIDSNRDKEQSGSKPCRCKKVRGEMVSHTGQNPSGETAPRRQPGGPLAYGKEDQRPLNTNENTYITVEKKDRNRHYNFVLYTFRKDERAKTTECFLQGY